MGYRRHNSGKGGVLLLASILIVPALIWGGFRIYASIDYDRMIGGHLKRAADANTVTIAEKELDYAIVEIEKRGWTAGSTHVIYSTPSTDVGFWYENLKASRDELKNLNPEASQLEQTNVLMKLRETILDEGESVSVTAPDNISTFPNNAAYFWTGWLVAVLCIVGILIGAVALHD